MIGERMALGSALGCTQRDAKHCRREQEDGIKYVYVSVEGITRRMFLGGAIYMVSKCGCLCVLMSVFAFVCVSMCMCLILWVCVNLWVYFMCWE